MVDLSASETRTVFEEQKRIIRELQDKLADKEFQIVEGEKLRKKLHNTILVMLFLLRSCYLLQTPLSVVRHYSPTNVIILFLFVGAKRKYSGFLPCATFATRGWFGN